jgi:hypothetical protein
MNEIQELKFEIKLLEKQIRVLWKHLESIENDFMKRAKELQKKIGYKDKSTPP